jgi:hypothetical protein
VTEVKETTVASEKRTRYRVYFRADGPAQSWEDVGVFEGRPRDARAAAFDANEQKPGTYQAWPERSYDPKKCGLRPTYHEAN